MARPNTSLVSNNNVRGFLRLFYMVWNIMGTIIIGATAYNPIFTPYDFKTIFMFIIGYLICTFISYFLGVILRAGPLGLIDTGLSIKTRITFKTYALALMVQTIPLWGGFMINESWQTPVIVAIGVLFIWLSAKSIKINIPRQTSET